MRAPYIRAIQRKFAPKDRRVQFNFSCDRQIHAVAIALAGSLDVPLYILVEHALQVGLLAVLDAQSVPERRTEMVKHLVEGHLQHTHSADGSEPRIHAFETRRVGQAHLRTDS